MTRRAGRSGIPGQLVDGETFIRQQVLAWSERVFQDKVIELALVLGWSHIYHTHDSRRSPSGFPDLVICRPRDQRLVFAELKKMKGKVTVEQQSWLDALGSMDSSEYGDDLIRVCLWRPCCWVSGEIEGTLR